MEILLLIIAFCGGIFGASLGALATFVFVGFTGLIGVAAIMGGSTADWLGVITFGSFLGPHVALVGGVSAAAFARKKGYIESGKDITKSLLSLRKSSVMMVAGIFGIVGYIVNYYVGLMLPGKIDTVGFTVFLVPLLAKVLFGNDGLKEIFGVVPEDVKKLGGRFSVKAPVAWVPYVVTATEKTIVGISAGGLSAYATYALLQDPTSAPAAVFVGFLISAASLIFLYVGIEIPVTHHITVCASYAVVASGGSFYWGLAAAVTVAFVGEICSRLFYVYGDTHIDPPGTSIAIVSFIVMGILPSTGIYQDPIIIPSVIVGVAILYSFIQSFTMKNNVEVKN